MCKVDMVVPIPGIGQVSWDVTSPVQCLAWEGRP